MREYFTVDVDHHTGVSCSPCKSETVGHLWANIPELLNVKRLVDTFLALSCYARIYTVLNTVLSIF